MALVMAVAVVTAEEVPKTEDGSESGDGVAARHFIGYGNNGYYGNRPNFGYGSNGYNTGYGNTGYNTGYGNNGYNTGYGSNGYGIGYRSADNPQGSQSNQPEAG